MAPVNSTMTTAIQQPLIEGIPEKDMQKPQDHAVARLVFERALGDLPYAGRYLALLDAGWGQLGWRKAAYIAWASMPSDQREPSTQGEFAIYIGVKDQGTIRKWRMDNPAIDAMVSRFSMGSLLAHVADVDEALLKSAKDPSYKHKPDRDLFYLRTGIMVPKSRIGISIEDNAAQGSAVEDMTDDELLAAYKAQQQQLIADKLTPDVIEGELEEVAND